MAVDEATAAFLAALPVPAGGLAGLNVDQARQGGAVLFDFGGPGPEMTVERTTRIRVSGGHVAIHVLIPAPQPEAVIVYLHGGGWVIGDTRLYTPFGRHLAARTGYAVCLVEYRKAPEYRFPTAVDDATSAVSWVTRHVGEIAGRTVPVVVAGDSAGGNLAAVAALRLRTDSVHPDAQLLLYPVTDCDFQTTSYSDPANQVFLARESMQWFWEQYAPADAGRLHPDASPLREPDLRGAPPAVIVTAEHDVLRDDGEVYATRLLKAKVPVRHRRFAGQIHGFFTLPRRLPVADTAMDWVVNALGDLLAPAPAA